MSIFPWVGGQGYPLFDVLHPAFSLPTTALPTLQGALMDGFGEAVAAYNVPKPCEFLSLYSCQKRFFRPTREFILLRTQALVLCSKWKMRRNFLRHLVSKACALFLRLRKQGPCFSAIEENGGNRRPVELELACEANGVASTDPV